MSEKIVGVLGGMGPEATVDFLAKVIALTPVKKDQDHLRMIVDSNPKIGDRTEGILTGDETLLPMLVAAAKNLERAGVDFVVIPCNTVHYLYEDLSREISVPILNMIREVACAVQNCLPECKMAGLLATKGTIVNELYQQELYKIGIEVIVPDTQSQTIVMDAIQLIKAGCKKSKARGELLKIANQLIARKAQALVLGCTEISLVLKARDFSVPVFDSNRILAKAAVQFARPDLIG